MSIGDGHTEFVRTPRRIVGREVRRVAVKGRDVADTMIGAGLARRYRGEPEKWCGSSAD